MLLVKEMSKKMRYFILIVLFMIVEPSINSWLNFWLRKLFDSTSAGVNRIFILRLLSIGFLIWILKRMLIYSSSVIRTRFICDIKKGLKTSIFNNIIEQDISKVIKGVGSGQYISVFTNDINILEQRYYENWLELISNCFSVIILGGAFFALNVKIGGCIIAFGLLSLIIVPVVFSRKLNMLNLKYSENLSTFTQKVKEYFEAYPTIKNYSIERQITQQFNHVNDQAEESKFNAETTMAIANNIGSLLSWFMQFIATGLGLMLVVKGEILIGTVIASQGFASDLASPLQGIVGNINSINSVKTIAHKIEGLSGEKGNGRNEKLIESSSSITSMKVNHRGGDLEFEHVSLKVGQKDIIRNFSYCFESGKKYLVIGKNGSGKSSLFKTIKRHFSSWDGKITINHKDMAELSSGQISNIMSYMNEKISLFSGKVSDNVCLFREYSQETIEAAINKVQLALDLERPVDDSGNCISSGEQRKIEITRSLLNLVDILVLDEVLSTVDIETAYEIEKMMFGYADKTVIIISHNFSGDLIREYDSILIMENGELIASGKYDELISTNEYFRKICKIKFGKL